MKIYFTASARGVDNLSNNYSLIHQYIEDLEHTNLDNNVLQKKENIYGNDHSARVKLYNEAMAKIKKSDLVVLEVSTHSLSMGFVMQKALELGKPVVALYKKGFDPYFASGIVNDKLQVVEYTDYDLKEVLLTAINFASDQQDTRFNFFISPRHQNYLDWIAKHRKLPRSVYLRDLIEKDMAENKDYN